MRRILLACLILFFPIFTCMASKFTIRFSTWHVPTSREVQTVWIPMLEEIKKRSQGRLDYQLFAGGALGKGPEHHDIVRDGLSDMGYFTATWTPGRFPLTDVLSLPAWFEGKDLSTEVGNAVFKKVLYREFQDVKVLELNPCIQSFFWTKKPVRSLNDLKGLRLRTPGGMQTRMIKVLGAEPVFMPLGDVYTALQMGTIDGLVTCPPLVLAYNLFEVVPNCFMVTLGCVSEGVVANLRFWNSLPDDLKATVEAVASNPYKVTGGLTKKVYVGLLEELKGKGVKFETLPVNEDALWRQKVQEVTEQWVEELEKKGIPAREAVKVFCEECSKKKVDSPACPVRLK